MKHIIKLALLIGIASTFTACQSEATTLSDSKNGSSNESHPATIEITAKKALTLLKENPEIIVIDVRTPKEYAEGHISKAQNIDFKSNRFRQELAKLDRNQTYLVHCKSGTRSGKSLPEWEKLGFTKIYHLNSGIDGWKKEQLPVTTH